jgi:hypothetical protein
MHDDSCRRAQQPPQSVGVLSVLGTAGGAPLGLLGRQCLFVGDGTGALLQTCTIPRLGGRVGRFLGGLEDNLPLVVADGNLIAPGRQVMCNAYGAVENSQLFLNLSGRPGDVGRGWALSH